MLLKTGPAEMVEQDRRDDARGDQHHEERAGIDLAGDQQLSEDNAAAHQTAAPCPPGHVRKLLHGRPGEPARQKAGYQNG